VSGETGDEYAVLEVRDAWQAVSLLCFAGALGSKLLVAMIPRDLRPPRWGVLLPLAVTLVLALAGLLCGLVALRRSSGRGASRIAVFLNAVVVGLALLALVAFFAILGRR
jgi:hypothetical protein